MEAKEFIDLFNFCWFDMEILKKQSRLLKSSDVDANPVHQNQEEASKPELYRVPTIISRSMSDQFGSGLSLSPDSVLPTPKLQTILSDKVIEEGGIQTQRPFVQESHTRKTRSRRREKRTLSKSLSELEFEELKGFMDLGFMFSEEDKDSSLVSIVPGLQRLGKKDGEEESGGVDEAKVSRPYLSEAWHGLERRKKEDALMNWRLPALSNEIDMKDNLKSWAHTVASTVR
ncbi:hypothetical protein MANES_16G042211v8 [Manihot esculenta]|uniref:Uncharacterized protein n=2 Tax=Manihot esculenta TaxID=3983 RepID=A0ACB7G9T0_MANES|nr:hypothetical protein MANES_16G042211v8 [Manihot esculenta]